MKTTFKLIEPYTRKSAGKAIINGYICHHKFGRWIVCGDCNSKKKLRNWK